MNGKPGTEKQAAEKLFLPPYFDSIISHIPLLATNNQERLLPPGQPIFWGLFFGQVDPKTKIFLRGPSKVQSIAMDQYFGQQLCGALLFEGRLIVNIGAGEKGSHFCCEYFLSALR